VAAGVALRGRQPTPAATYKYNTSASLRGNRSNLNRLNPISPDNSASLLAFVKTKKSLLVQTFILRLWSWRELIAELYVFFLTSKPKNN